MLELNLYLFYEKHKNVAKNSVFSNSNWVPGNCQNPEFCVNISIASSDHYVVRPPHISPFFKLRFGPNTIKAHQCYWNQIWIMLSLKMFWLVFQKIMFASITTFARKKIISVWTLRKDCIFVDSPIESEYEKNGDNIRWIKIF